MSDDIITRLREYFNSPTAIDAADEIERLRVIVQGWENSARNSERDITELRATIRTQQDRIEQSVRDNNRTVYLCAARYHRLQAIRDLVVKHGVVDPLRHDILRQTDSLD